MSKPGSNDDQAARPSLISDFAGDADMADLIEFFVEELGDRIKAIGTALAGGNIAELRRLANQIRSAAGGYGFPILSQVAGELEVMLRAAEPSMPALADKVAALTLLCHRASAGIRTSE